uniref:Uncharacterized protein n=1 Tax=Sphaerodactylus townsendi TaxID=933632 RepID=A0ACB8F4D6_9SAUR
MHVLAKACVGRAAQQRSYAALCICLPSSMRWLGLVSRQPVILFPFLPYIKDQEEAESSLQLSVTTAVWAIFNALQHGFFLQRSKMFQKQLNQGEAKRASPLLVFHYLTCRQRIKASQQTA